MVSKVHVTFTAGIIAVTSIVCGTIAMTEGHDASQFFVTAGICVGVIGGVAVPSYSPAPKPEPTPRAPISGPPTP